MVSFTMDRLCRGLTPAEFPLRFVRYPIVGCGSDHFDARRSTRIHALGVRHLMGLLDCPSSFCLRV
jgi:hypothetical protein